MIVRINQLEASAAERATGWQDENLRGPIERAWPEDTFAYQVLILDYDEQHQPVNATARREQIRQIVPKVIDALTTDCDRVVVRLDGLFGPDGVAPAFLFAADPERCLRFSYSAADQLADRDEPPVISIRLYPRPHHLTELCAEPAMSLYKNVRLRAFGLPDELVDPMLDTADLDDERWRDLLPSTAFMVSTSYDLQSLLIWTSRYNADDARRRITDRLGGKERANGSAAGV